MEKINFTVMPSLEHLALFKIAITLWKKQSERLNCNEIYSVELSSFWKRVDTGSEKSVNELSLPARMKINIRNVYRIVCMEIRSWIKLHSKFLSKEFHWLCIYADWTPIGEIDYKKTALKLVRDEKVPVMDRYELACIYCFDEFIDTLFNKLIGDHNYDFKRDTKFDGDFFFRLLIYVWFSRMEGNHYFSDDKLFAYAACSGNRAAAQYFFLKLSIGAKYKCLGTIANALVDSLKRRCTIFPHEEYSKILFFLLQQMNIEQVTELMESKAYDVLKCFLDWPLQYHFMDVCKYAWNHLNESSYNSILGAIALKYVNGYQDWNYKELWKEFLQQSPDACKRYYFKGGGNFFRNKVHPFSKIW